MSQIDKEPKLPPSFSFSTIKNDFPSGLVVFLVALPLCLGIALASGAPLFSGIIAGIVGGTVVALASGSSLSVSGPAAGLAAIVAVAIEDLGSYETFLVAVVFAGILQIILGYLRAGIIGYYFPSSVIKGMLAAIGLLLILKQIPHALGYDSNYEGDESFTHPPVTDFQFSKGSENTFTEILHAFANPHMGAVIIALISLTIILLWDTNTLKRFTFFKLVPSPLIVVVLGVVMNSIFQASFPALALSGNHLVVLPIANSIREFSNQFTFPDFSQLSNSAVYVTAVTLAIVASLESLLSVEAADKLDPYKRNTPTNRELKAQGLGNLISGLIGGLPVTAVIVRSSANINSGAKTKMSAFIHGLLLLASVVFIPGILNRIPLAALAAILLVIGYKLSKIALYRSMYKIGWDQFLPFIITILAILFTDLLKGIGIGMAVSIFFILRNNYKNSYYFHRLEGAEGNTIKILLSQEVTFLNKGNILATLDKIPENSNVIIDGSESEYIDYDVLEIIQEYKRKADLRNIKLKLININEVSASGAH